MIIGGAQYVLLHMLILAQMLVVSHPSGDSEGSGQPVIENRHGNGNGRGSSVKLKHLVGLVAFVGNERPGPLGPQTRIGQQVDRGRRRTAELPLGLDAVGVAIASLSNVP